MVEILRRIKKAVLAGNFVFSRKADDEMEADGISSLDVKESIMNATGIRKVIRSRSNLRQSAREYLYVIQSPNRDGLLIYTKGVLRRESGKDVFYVFVSAKISE